MREEKKNKNINLPVQRGTLVFQPHGASPCQVNGLRLRRTCRSGTTSRFLPLPTGMAKSMYLPGADTGAVNNAAISV